MSQLHKECAQCLAGYPYETTGLSPCCEALLIGVDDTPREAAMTNHVLETLAERARWYRDGCDGLEDVEGYFASGDVARDAASDLESALSEIRVLEAVISKLRTASSDATSQSCLAEAREFVTLVNTVWSADRDGRAAKRLADKRCEELARRIMEGS